MASDVIEIIDFSPEHIAGAHVLSVEAGWPHRPEDWALVLSIGRGFVALDGGRVVGTAMMTPFGETAAAVNMVIVAESMRGRGLGRRLMNAALAAAEGRECRLTATTDGLPLYEKLGFRVTHDIVQRQGMLGTPTGAVDPDVAWAGAEDLDTIAAMDRQAIGMDRRDLIEALAAAGRFAVLKRQGGIAGFVAVRRFGRGEVAGPVVALSGGDAEALLDFVFAARAGSFMRVDTPEFAGLGPFLGRRGLAPVGGGTAMRRNPAPTAASPFATFALASQALG